MEYLVAPAFNACVLRRRPRYRAFTLIELLVVTLIMGLLVGLVSVAIRPGERAVLATEAQRLAQLLDLAAAEARASGMPLRWSAGVKGYQFRAFREGAGWLPRVGDDALRERVWSAAITVTRVTVEGAARRGPPLLDFYPDAPPLLFSIDLALGAERVRVAMSPLGAVRVLPVEGLADAAPAF